MGQREWGPRHKPGLNPARVTLHLRDFRKNAELSMYKLTTEWILENWPKSCVCTYHNMDFRKNVLWPWSGELLIPRSERELRRSEGSGMLIGDPLGEGSSASSTDGKLWRAENSFLRERGNSDAPKGAACS